MIKVWIDVWPFRLERLILFAEDYMIRRFPVRPKAAFPKAVSGEAMPFNMKPILYTIHNKVVPFPNLSRNKTKKYPAILNFPVRI